MPPFLDPVERLALVRDGFYSHDARQHTRAAVLLSLDRGCSISDVARSVKVTRHTIKSWRDRYLEIRTPAALEDGRSRRARRAAARRRPTRTRLVYELALVGPADAAGRLDLDAGSRAELARLAVECPDPERRHWAAILWARDRGVPVSVVARAAGRHRSTLYRDPARRLAWVLDGRGG